MRPAIPPVRDGRRQSALVRGTAALRGGPRRRQRPSVQSPRVKVLALDYGAARTGVAVSDPTGTLARPLEVVERAGSTVGLERIAGLARDEGVERVVVGMPMTLRGERGADA